MKIFVITVIYSTLKLKNLNININIEVNVAKLYTSLLHKQKKPAHNICKHKKSTCKYYKAPVKTLLAKNKKVFKL